MPEDRDNVLVLHGDERRGGIVSRALADGGFRTTVETSPLRGLERMRRREVALAVIHLDQSDMGGVSVLRTGGRVAPDVPMIVLSPRGDVQTKVICLELGARDYLTTPLDPAELVARARVHVRRAEPTPELPLCAGGMMLDRARRVVRFDGRAARLTMREFSLLEFLMERDGEVVTREAIRVYVWGSIFDPGTRVVEGCVAGLRRKVGNECLTTVRGVGYAFVGRRSDAASASDPAGERDGYVAQMTVVEDVDRKLDAAAFG